MNTRGDANRAVVERLYALMNERCYNNHYHMLFVFSDGLIQRVKEYNDTLHAHETFGDL